MVITTAMQENMLKVLGLDTLPKEEQEQVFLELGAPLIESALLQFLTSQGEWEQQSFEAWIDDHKGDDDMLEQLVTGYPAFGKILTEEILLLKERFAAQSQ